MGDSKPMSAKDLALSVTTKTTLKAVKEQMPEYKHHLHRNQWAATFFRHLDPTHHERFKSLRTKPKEKPKADPKPDTNVPKEDPIAPPDGAEAEDTKEEPEA